jgi:hypothetical protein
MLTSLLQSHTRRIRAGWLKISRPEPASPVVRAAVPKARIVSPPETDWGTTILSYDNVY